MLVSDCRPDKLLTSSRGRGVNSPITVYGDILRHVLSTTTTTTPSPTCSRVVTGAGFTFTCWIVSLFRTPGALLRGSEAWERKQSREGLDSEILFPAMWIPKHPMRHCIMIYVVPAGRDSDAPITM